MYDKNTDTLGEATETLLGNTAEVVAAYLSNNHVLAAELPGVIAAVHASLVAVAAGTVAAEEMASAEPAVEKPTAAQIRKSITRDGLVSFIDGKAYKTLKRHLTANGLTPDAYRERFGLPADYPMVAPSYSEARSALAKAMGLGVPGARAGKAPSRRKAA